MKSNIEFYPKIFKNPNIEINLIGYSEQGESIVIFIRDEINGKVIFSYVVDCYESEKNNITFELLKENCIESIDVFCWTHPHEDHSKGIEKLFDFFGKKTKIIIPPNVLVESLPMKIQELYYNITTINRNGTTKNGTLVLTSDTKNLFDKSYIDSAKRQINVQLIGFTPISARLLNQSVNKEIDYNEFSIMTLLEINDIKLLLTGDVQRGTIEKFKIENEKIGYVDYLKAPHHSSKTSNNLLDIIDTSSENSICATTIFKRYNLPDKEVIEKFKENFGCIICTNESYFNNSRNISDYGVARISIDLNTNEYTVGTIGNAMRLEM